MEKSKNENKTFKSYFVSKKEKDFFLENLSILISSGVELITSLNNIQAEVKSSKAKRVIKYITEEVESGNALWKAMENTKILSSRLISLIKIGEESGRLAENLKIVVNQQEKEDEFHSKIRSALIYPVFILTVMFVVGSGLILFILPKLSEVYTNLNLDLPLITRILINFGRFVSAYGFIVFPILFAIVFLTVFILFINNSTKHLGQSFLLKVPVIKTLIIQIETSRFGFVLGTLLSAGLPISYSISSLVDSTEIRKYKKFYNHIKDSIEEGASFQKSFETYAQSKKLLPSYVKQVIVTGEKSGNLPDIFLKISDVYNKKNETITRDFSAILEPVLLLIIWVGVTIVALAVVMPIYNLVGNVDEGSSGTTNSSDIYTTVTPTISPVPTVLISPTPQVTVKLSSTPIITSIPSSKVEVIADTVSVWPQKSFDEKPKEYLSKGDTYPFVSKDGTWYGIKLEDGSIGYVLSNYLKEV